MTHRILQGDLGSALAAARGLKGVLPLGRKGNPDSDDDWFITDWMDTTRAQEALSFQHHSWQQMMGEAEQRAGASKYLLRLAAPLARAILTRRGAYWKQPGRYADPWGAIRRRIGEPSPDA